MAGIRKVRDFLSLTTTKLKQFLRDRGVSVTEQDHNALAEKAFWAEKLALPLKLTDKEAEVEIEKAKARKLILDGGLIHLPRPETILGGWEDGPASLPDTSREHLDSYIRAGNRRIGLVKTEGTRTFALGKSLYLSCHVRGLQYHGISPNLTYCFVRGKVIPQVKTSEDPYHTWVVLNKETGQIVTAECSCCIGIQATCKHICAMLFAIVGAVEEGKNISSTSQKQVWGAPARKGTKIHQPEFAKNLKILGVKADVSDQALPNSRSYRSEFEPRIVAHQGEKSIKDFNLDWLASATNGNCGVLAYVKKEADPTRKTPNITSYEEEVTVETTKFVQTISEVFQNSIENESVNINKMLSLLKTDQHQQMLLAEETKEQASSPLWAKHRTGRITASVAGDCVKSVKDNGSVSGYSNIARVMGYYSNSTSPSLNWGKNQESIARKHYIAWHKLNYRHAGVSCAPTGLWIVSECPYVAASPDGLISCHHCGNGLLEIKNPYTYRLHTIEKLAATSESCLTKENGVLQLKRNHSYYAQVQVQMWATGFTWCDFVVRTISKGENIFVERIPFNSQYIASIKPKLLSFFINGIVPELKTRKIEMFLIKKSVQKVISSILDKIDSGDTRVTYLSYPCGVCARQVGMDGEDTDSSIGCDNCNLWFHFKCQGIKGTEKFLKRRKAAWKCSSCMQDSVKKSKRLRKL